ncbi:E3 ubiquitin-protein ligase RAD18, partial [Phenoliferia sp. Uapishka_3]
MDLSIDSPEDFSSPELRNLDRALRCTICQEFLVAPMIITAPTCGHSFCSQCVRDSMAQLVGKGDRARCPQCLVDANPGLLRPQKQLSDAVDAWVKARPALLKLQAYSTASTSAHQGNSVASTSTARHSKKGSKTKAIQIPSSDIDDTDPEDAAPQSRVTRSSTQTSKKGADAKLKEKGKGKTVVIVEPRNHDGNSSDLEIIESPPMGTRNTKEIVDFQEVQCPICNGAYKKSEIEKHASRCDGTIKPATKDAWSRIMPLTSTSAPEKSNSRTKQKSKAFPPKSVSPSDDERPIIVRDYAHIKIKDLEALLTASNLPTSVPPDGDKVAVWKRRHAHWTTLWNANLDLDADDPRRKNSAMLRKELRVWEKTLDEDVTESIKPKAHSKKYDKQFQGMTQKMKAAREEAKNKKKRDSEAVKSEEDAGPKLEDVDMLEASSEPHPPSPIAPSRPPPPPLGDSSP